MGINANNLRSPRLPDGAPLDYAPNNEQGVIYLFSHLARKRFGLHVEKVQAGFPDCIAYRQGKAVRIEFEFRSRNFCLHRHPVEGCDCIVCWVHDWYDVPRRLEVIELRKEFGLGFNVWFVPSAPWRIDKLHGYQWGWWSVPSQATDGDLLLMYRTSPDCCVRDIFRIATAVKRTRRGAHWRGKNPTTPFDWWADIKRVAVLKTPLYFSELKERPKLCEANFVRGFMRGRPKATEHWPEIYRMILARNPALRIALAKFGPERLW